MPAAALLAVAALLAAAPPAAPLPGAGAPLRREAAPADAAPPARRGPRAQGPAPAERPEQAPGPLAPPSLPEPGEAAAPPAGTPASGTPASSTDTGPAFALWMQPVGTALLPGLGADVRYLPFGLTFALGPRLAVGLEVTAVFGDSRPLAEPRTTPGGGFQQLYVAAGPVIPVLGASGPLKGAFVQPKVSFVRSADSDDVVNGVVRFPVGLATEVQFGIDAGYQVVLGPLHLTPVVGVGVGYCRSCADERLGALLAPLPLLFGPSAARSNRLVTSLNLNLLRLGLAL